MNVSPLVLLFHYSCMCLYYLANSLSQIISKCKVFKDVG